MHIPNLAVLLLGLLATADSAPLNADRQLTDRSLSQEVEKRSGRDLSKDMETAKRDDDGGAVVNVVVKYSDDEITKREVDGSATLNMVVKYSDDEITK